MAFLQPTFVTSSSRPFMQGDLAVLDLADFFEELPELLAEELQATAEREQERLKAQAQMDTSWAGMSETLYVEFDGESLDYGSTSPSADELEFGNGKQPPRPLLRRAVTRFIGQNPATTVAVPIE